MAHVGNTLGEFLGLALRMNQEYTPARHWVPAPLLYASAALHVGAAAWVIAQPRSWPWALCAVAANHMALSAVSLWPRSRLLGPNWTRLPVRMGARGAVAITIDDGPEPDVTPQVLALLDRYQAPATFFCIGERVSRYADLAQEIVRRGHSIENHTQCHRHNFSLLGPAAMNTEISRAQEIIFRTTGTLPKYFRAPAGLRNPFLDPVLVRLGLSLVSWTRRGFDTVNPDANAVFRRLAAPLQGGDILLLHDGHAARGRGGSPVILDVLPRLLDALHAKDLTPVGLRAALS
jgi:peptidoglycan-N-acetylglucosamine deacetylase